MRAPGWVDAILWLLSCERTGSAMTRYVSGHRVQTGLPPHPDRDFQEHLAGQGSILAAHPNLAPLPDDCTFPCRRNGFLVLPASGEPGLSTEVKTFLHAGQLPAHVCFGSMPSQDAARWTRAIVDGVQRAGSRAILAGGWAGLGSDAVRGNGPCR